MTTFQFILSQRDKENAEAAARGIAPPTCSQRRRGWINRNAPCLAVCELCDDPPPKPPPGAVVPAPKPPSLASRMGSSLRKQMSDASGMRSRQSTEAQPQPAAAPAAPAAPAAKYPAATPAAAVPAAAPAAEPEPELFDDEEEEPHVNPGAEPDDKPEGTPGADRI